MAARRYQTLGGKAVPSVTTILSRFKQAEGLMHWAWEQGRDGKDYRESRDDAATAGTLAHMLIENYVLGGDASDITGPEEQMALAHSAFEAFLSWQKSTRFEILKTELSLVSETHSFGGTIDCVGRIGARLVLGDWKSSNRIYSDYLAQLGGYALLYEENFPGERFDEVHLLRFGKEFADFHHHSWPRAVLEIGMDSFLGMRKLYENDKILRKAVG